MTLLASLFQFDRVENVLLCNSSVSNDLISIGFKILLNFQLFKNVIFVCGDINMASMWFSFVTM